MCSGKVAWAIIILCAFLCGLLAWLTPYNHDDLFYTLPYRELGSDDALTSVRFPSLQEFKTFAWNHYMNTNGRIGDKLLTPALLLPKWLFSLFTALAVMVILDAGRFISSGLRDGRWRILGAVLAVFCLPWYNLMFTGAFSVNYLWGSALAIVCFSYMTGLRSVQRWWTRLLLCVLILLGGAWHEGFAMTVGCAVAVYFVVYRLKIDKWQWVYLLLWICGAAIVIFAPSSWDRMATSGSPFDIGRVFSRPTLVYFNVALLYVPLCAWCFVKHSIRKQMSLQDKALLIALLSMLAVNLYIIGRTYCVARIVFFSMVFVLPGIILTLRLLLRPVNKCFVPLSCIAGAVLAIVHLCSCVYWQASVLNNDYRTVHRLFTHGHDTIYYDLTTDDTLPWYVLGKPSGYMLHNSWGLTCFSNYYGSGGRQLYIVPSRFAHIKPTEEGVALNDSNYFRVGNDIIAETFPEGRSRKVWFRRTSGKLEWLHFTISEFIAGDGKKYFWLEPVNMPLSDSSAIDSIIKVEK